MTVCVARLFGGNLGHGHPLSFLKEGYQKVTENEKRKVRVHAKGVVLRERACFCLLSAFYNTVPSKNPSKNPCPY